MIPRHVLASSLLLAAVALCLAAAARPSRAEESSISRADALNWLHSVEKAYAREDLEALLALSANEVMKRQIEMRVGRLFEERNYFKLQTRLLEHAARPDGTVEIEFLEVMHSRPTKEKSELREKARRRVRLERREGRVVVIDSLEADQPLLPSVGVWSAELWSGRVELQPRALEPFGSPEGDAKLSVSVRLRNVSDSATRELPFGLHPFVSELDLSLAGGPALLAERHEGTADAWLATLPEAVEAGQAVELRFDYALHEIGEGANSSIGPGGAQLFPEAAWLPLFAPTAMAGADRASHDLTIVVPGGWTAVAPGTLEGDERLEDGRRALRWVSSFPGEAVVILAGQLQRRELRLTEGLSVEIVTQDPARELPPRLLEALASMSRHFERILGPAPVDRFCLVESRAPGLRAQPGFYIIDDLELMEAELFERRREQQPLFYLAHQLTHLWLQDGVRPIGGPAQVLTEGLCDHLAFDWMDAEVNDQVSLWHRDRILHVARSKPAADRPILLTHPGARDHDVFGAGKALVVLDGLRSFAGRDRWQGLLRGYAQTQRGRQVDARELLAAFGAGDPRLKAYVESWIVGKGLADIAVHEPSTRERIDEQTGEVRYEVELIVENLGLGPVPVALRTIEDRPDSTWREEQIELASLERTVLRYELAAPLRIVEVDQRMVTWQSAISNDTFPVRQRKPKTFPGEHRKLTEEDQARLEQLLKD